MKTKNWELDLSLRIAPVYAFYYPSLVNGFEFEKAGIGLEGEYDNRVKIVLNFDLLELFAGSDFQGAKLIEDLYLLYDFHTLLQVRAGQYKVPLGEEITLGMAERPYLKHSLGSRKLAPGQRQGLMISGKDFFSFLGYRIGIFNTSEAEKGENGTPYLATAGKLFLEFDDLPGLYFKSSYSVYYSLDEIFAQSASLFFTWQINPVHKLTLFGEYLEERFYHYSWNNSFFLFLSYRPGDFEIYSAGEFYDENFGKEDKDDCFSISSGINIYWIKDRLRVGLNHEYKNEYTAGEEENRFALMIMWEL